MTDPPIRTIDGAAAESILAEGRPAGLWLAKSPEQRGCWIGVDSTPGHLALRREGPFAEGLDWLFLRGGIEKPKTAVTDRDAPESRTRRTWKPKRKEEKKAPVRRGRPAGKRSKGSAERDEEIRAAVIGGLRNKDIANMIGRTARTVSARVTAMRRAGVLKDEDMPEQRLHDLRSGRPRPARTQNRNQPETDSAGGEVIAARKRMSAHCEPEEPETADSSGLEKGGTDSVEGGK